MHAHNAHGFLRVLALQLCIVLLDHRLGLHRLLILALGLQVASMHLLQLGLALVLHLGKAAVEHVGLVLRHELLLLSKEADCMQRSLHDSLWLLSNEGHLCTRAHARVCGDTGKNIQVTAIWSADGAAE